MKKLLLFFLMASAPFIISSCVPPAPCEDCGPDTNGNGYNSSQLYEGDLVTAQVLSRPTSFYGIPLDNNWDGLPDFLGVARTGQIVSDIQYVWDTGFYPMVTGYVTRVNPIDVKITAVLTNPGKMDVGSEFEIEGEAFVVCLITQDKKGGTFPGNNTLRVLRSKTKIKKLQGAEDK